MVVLDSRRFESGFQVRELLDPRDAAAAHHHEPGPSAEKIRATALQRALVGRIGLDAGEPHAYDDALRQTNRPVDDDVVPLRDALGEDFEDAIAVDDHGVLAGGNPLDIGVEHHLERGEIARDERAIAAEEKLDARVTHAAESMELNGALSNPLETDKNPLNRLEKLVRELVGRAPNAASGPVRPRRCAPIRGAVEAVVKQSAQPMRVGDVSAALLAQGHDTNKASIRKALHDRPRGPAPRLLRIGHGLYTGA